jgi:hypothetical protein
MYINLKINNSAEASIKDSQWKNPGASLYDKLLDSFYYPSDDVDDPKNLYPSHYLKEAYLIAPINKIKNSPYGRTPYSRSGCKYPHHNIRNNELVLDINGVKAAYVRARQMGIFKGDVKEHLMGHIEELNLMEVLHIKNDDIIEENFNFIESHLYISESVNNPNTGDTKKFYEIFNMLNGVHYGMYNTKLKKVLYSEIIDDEINLLDYLDQHGDSEFIIMKPDDVIKYKAGTCWDTSLFIYAKLIENGFNPQVVFYVINDNNHIITHSTIVVEDSNRVKYNIEYSHSVRRGIHQIDKIEDVYGNEDDIIFVNNNVDVTKLLKKNEIKPDDFIKATEWNPNKSIVESTTYYDFFNETSHGLLKSSFRYGVNIENGHRIKIVFDLDVANIKFTGHDFGGDATNKTYDANKNISKKGNNDFVSIGTVKAIIDEDTNERLQSVKIVGSLNKYMMNIGPFIEPEGGPVWNIAKEERAKESFELNSLRLREMMVKSKNWNPPSNIVNSYKVGQKEDDPTYKATRPAANIFDLASNINSHVRSPRFNAKGVPDDTKTIKRKIHSTYNEFKIIYNAAFNIAKKNNDVEAGEQLKKLLDTFGSNVKNGVKYISSNEVNSALDIQNELINIKSEARKILDSLKSKYKTESASEIMMKDNFAFIESFVYSAQSIQEDTSINESYVFSQDNLEIDLDQWSATHGKNLLFITGQAGSGKSTLARSMAKQHHAVWFGLDFFEQTDPTLKNISEWNKKYDDGDIEFQCVPFMLEYYKVRPELLTNWNTIVKDEVKFHHEFLLFLRWLINRLYKINQLFIIEGVQLAFYVDYAEYEKYPLIIMGSSMLKSTVRRIKRAEEKHGIKSAIRNLMLSFKRNKMFIDDEKVLDDLRDSANASKTMTADDKSMQKIIISKGTYLQRLTTSKNESNDERHIYVSQTKMDNDKYLVEWGNRGYRVTLEVTNDIIMPIYKERFSAFMRAIEGADVDRVANDISNLKYRNNGEKFLNEWKNRNTKEVSKESYISFISSLTSSDYNRQIFFKELKLRGYNATIDDNDAAEWTDKPIIIFERNKNIKQTECIKIDSAMIDDAKERLSKEKNMGIMEHAIYEEVNIERDEKIEVEKEVTDEPKEESLPKQTDAKEANKNGVKRKELYMKFIEYAKSINSNNLFGSVFDKDAFNIYSFVPHEMRYFYRLSNPLLCVLKDSLAFFALSELKKINKDNKNINTLLIFAADKSNKVIVFNNNDKAIYEGAQKNNEIIELNKIANSFDKYIENLIGITILEESFL